MLKLIIISSFISTLMLLYPILRFLIGKQKNIFRLRRYIISDEIKTGRKNSIQREYKPGFNILAKGIRNAKFLDSYKRRVQIQLTRAHVLFKPEEYITVCIVAFFASALIMFTVTGSLLLAAVVSITAWMSPQLILKGKIKRRVKSLNEQLSDAINLISNSLKAGYSFFQAVDVVAKEMHGPIAEEFAVLQKEVNLGLATEKALENLVTRSSSDDLELVVTAVLIQRQVGGNLSEILDNICSTIRERVKIKGEVKTLTAQGRMSGMIISILPPALGVILYLINPEHIGMLFNNRIGISILVYSILMELIGIYAINKIIKIEF